jgi:hypothetical protein
MFLKRFTRLKGIGRYACLGTAVLETLGRKYKMHNMQKGRVDYQLRCLEDASVVCRSAEVLPHLAREYIAPIVNQQSHVCAGFKPEVIIVDSFSELSDQLFQHKSQGWQFCCNYLDIAHSDQFVENFDSVGLLALAGLEGLYTSMLAEIELRWPHIPIIYLHFPDALEERETFVERGREIRRVVEAFAKQHPSLYSFSVPSEIVRHPKVMEPGLENFPYHYNQATYDAFAEMIRGHSALRGYF